MNQKLKSLVIKYTISFVVSSFLVYLTLHLQGYGELTDMVDKYVVLANAFTIPGVIFICISILIAVSNEGIFYGITYATTFVWKMLVPGTSKDYEKYGDYVERKKEKTSVKGYSFIFFTGCIFTLIAIVFIILYYKVI